MLAHRDIADILMAIVHYLAVKNSILLFLTIEQIFIY